MKIAHTSCLFSIKFAVFAEYVKTSIRHFSFLSDKNFQTVRQLSSNISGDFAKTDMHADELAHSLEKLFIHQITPLDRYTSITLAFK